MKRISLLFLFSMLLGDANNVLAQKKAAPKKAVTPTKSAVKASNTAVNEGFSVLESGLQYKYIKHGSGARSPKMGDHIEMHIHVRVNDSTMFDSRKMNNNKPVPFQVQAPSFKGDPIEGFMKMVAGDSVLLRLPVDSLIKQQKQLMPGMKSGDWLNYEVVLISVLSDEEFKKEQDSKLNAQKDIDDQLMQAYFKSNNIKAMRTPSGLYYTISKEGVGENAKKGQTVSVNYTGKLLGSDKPFDSNTDPEFKHPEPFSVVLGNGGVIKGWEEGLALMKKGTKGTLYIPSGLAYGAQDRSPTIPPNSILVFDMDILNVGTQADIDDKIIKEYLEKNKIKATKTASGMYYAITKEGTGDKPKAGQKVSVKYNGTFMDGKKFDGNMDRPEPFEFTLGQGAVIKGWDEGIALLRKGTKATLFLPSAVAYGERGTGPIPPNAVLLFDVELIDFK